MTLQIKKIMVNSFLFHQNKQIAKILSSVRNTIIHHNVIYPD